MTWEWSHSPEAYAAAQTHVENKPKEWLDVVYAEWQVYHHCNQDQNDFDQAKYEEALAEAKELPDSTLAEYIWEQMSEQANCSNGGHNAYCCPYGCGCHYVPFHLKCENGCEEELNSENAIFCTECNECFCDSCYDTSKGDGCRCHQLENEE